ncbi:hypothetical protein [Candidatus Pyrohabitans sp.]
MPGLEMNRLIAIVGFTFFVLLVGCTSAGVNTETASSPSTKAPISAQTQPPETSASEVLHGEGRCDQCHEAQTLDDIRAGVHELGFTLFEGHKEFCRECHDVQDTCTNCHGFPDVME